MGIGMEGRADGHSPSSGSAGAAQPRCYVCPLTRIAAAVATSGTAVLSTDQWITWNGIVVRPVDPPHAFPRRVTCLVCVIMFTTMQDARRFSYRRRSTLSLHRHLRAVAEAVPVRIPSPRVVVFRTVRHHSQGRKGIPYDVFLGTGRRYGQSRPARARQGTARCG